MSIIKPRMISRIVIPAQAVVLLSAVPVVHGGEWSYTVGDELGYSTNIGRTADREIEEYTNAVRFGVHYEENSVDLQGSVGFNVEHLSYLSGVFENEIRSYLNADLRWALLRDRLFWIVENNLSVEPVSSRRAWIPGNIQQTNMFSTGPSMDYRIGSTTRATIDMRYMNSYAEETTAFNSNRWYLGTSLIQERALSTDVSANLIWNSVDFKNEEADDYQQIGLFAAWDQQYGRSGLRIELGGLGIDFASGNSEFGPSARLVWNRLISSASRLIVGFNHGFSDAAQQVARSSRAAPASASIISSQVFTNSELELAYRTEWTQSALETALHYQKQDFLNSPDLDQHLFNIRVSLNRGFGANINTNLGISFARTVYEIDDRSDDTTSPFLGIFVERNPRLSYSFRAAWENRDSSVDSSDYRDLMIFAAFSYQR